MFDSYRNGLFAALNRFVELLSIPRTFARVAFVAFARPGPKLSCRQKSCHFALFLCRAAAAMALFQRFTRILEIDCI